MTERSHLSHVMAYAHTFAAAYALIHVDLDLILENFGCGFFLVSEGRSAKADRFGEVEESAKFKLRA